MTPEEYAPIIEPLKALESFARDICTWRTDKLRENAVELVSSFASIEACASLGADFPWDNAMRAECAAYYMLDELKDMKATVNYFVECIENALDKFHESYETLALKEGKLQERQMSKGADENAVETLEMNSADERYSTSAVR